MPDPKQQNNSTTNDKISNAQKGAFAIANNLSESLEQAVIGKKGLWDYIKHKHAVASRNDMTEQQ